MSPDDKADVLSLDEGYVAVVGRWIIKSNKAGGAASRYMPHASSLAREGIRDGTRAALKIPVDQEVTLGDVLKLTSKQLQAMKGVGPAARQVLESFLRAVHSKLSDGWPYKNRIPTSH